MSDDDQARRSVPTIAWVAAGFGFAVAVLAELMSFQLGAGAAAPAVMPLAQTYDLRAAQALASDRADARALTLKSLAIRPVNARAWLRLAQIDGDHPATFGDAARQSLSRSYETGPYDAHLLRERIRFAFDHWNQLGGDLQSQVNSEIDVAWPSADTRAELVAAAAGVNEPMGRLTLSTRLFTLKLKEMVAAQHATPAASPTSGPALRGAQ